MPTCPRCDDRLTARGKGLACGAHGLFLPAEALRTEVPFRTMAALDAAAAKGRAVSVRCPGCGDGMRELAVDEVHVDLCAACHGAWFDADELERVRRAPPPARLDDASRPAGTMGLSGAEVVGTAAIEGVLAAAEIAFRIALDSW